MNKKDTKTKEVISRPELRGGVGHQLATDPFLDWVIILAISTVLALTLVGLGIKVYFDTEKTLGTPAVSSDKKNPMPLDEALLKSVLTSFGTKAAEYNAIRRNSNTIADPSLP